MHFKKSLKKNEIKDDDFLAKSQEVASQLGVVINYGEYLTKSQSAVKILFPLAMVIKIHQITSIKNSKLRSVMAIAKTGLLPVADIEDLDKLISEEEHIIVASNNLDLMVLLSVSTNQLEDGLLLTFFQKSKDNPDGRLKRLEFLEKQMSLTLSRLKRMIPAKIVTNSAHKILELCASLFDQDAGMLQKKVLNYLIDNTSAETGFLLLVCLDTQELRCQVIGQVIQEDAINFDAEENAIFDTVMKTKKTVNLVNINEKQVKEIEEIMKESNQVIQIRSILCVPVCHQGTNDIIAIVCLLNNLSRGHFTEDNEHIINECFKYTTSVLFTTIAYQNERRLKLQTEKMLVVAKNIFSRMDNLNDLLLMIMQEARNLTQAERCSVFLVDEDSNELVAKVFDGLPTSNDKSERLRLQDGTEIQQPLEIRFPKSQGIAGHVATAGEMLNIKNAYSHPLFYRRVDDETGFKTRNILCFPIQDDCGKTVGVAQLCNKIQGHFFTKMDEEIAKAFSIYCCISITHSLMYKKVEDAQHRSRLANELMMYHMQIPEDDIAWLSTHPIPLVSAFLNDFESFNSIPRNIKDRDTLMACISMFDSIGLISRWRINRRTLTKFIYMIRRNYRDPPYHNWMHAFSVAHFVFICIKNLPLDQQLTELELFALFVASLSHDIDHRGTNNSFQVQSNSILAALYSSEGSVLERHHFSQTVCILNTEGCNVFETLPQREYIKVLDLIRDIILATDLAHHLQIFSKIELMAKNGYKPLNSDHHNLLLCLLMTSADLSDQTKNWRNTRSVAELIYKEFFRQGDLEKGIGNQPAEQMDRERAVVPNLQITFLDGIVCPLYRVLSVLYPETDCINHTIKRNRDNWSNISQMVASKKIKGNSEEIFRNKLVEDDFD